MGKKYINPPLISVISSVWWHIDSPIEFAKSKLINGLLYSKLKSSYPLFIESVDDPFKTILSRDNEEVVIELSNDEISVISTDSNYSWDEFFKNMEIIFPELNTDLNNLVDIDHYHARLEYLDFFSLENDEDLDLVSFLGEKLKINISSPLFNNPMQIDLEFTQKIEEGYFTINPYVGKRDDQFGVFVKFTLYSFAIENYPNEIMGWFEKAHSICSKYFNEMIEGDIRKTLKHE